ncbi:MAG TPA: efflux RND transporter permease subunit [Thermoanaerobaculia bacterium]|nr:efflux RND transporter permease subunit [Thermoanaerobaculia bacterium]
MKPLRLAEHHGRAVIVLTVLVAAAGALLLPTLPSSIYPPLQFPRILVIGHSGILPARSMLLAVTRPLEQAAMEVPGIRRVRSRTFRGSTEISAQFAPSTDMTEALQQLQNRVAEARPEMPADVDLTVERLTAASFPILSLNLTGNLPDADLRDDAFFIVRPAVSRVPGVGRVEVMASDSREIEVVTDPGKLLAAGLSVHDVAEALRAANQIAPVGRFTAAGRQHLVLASDLFTSPAQIAETPVAVRHGATIRVGDVAAVFPGAPDRTSLVTGNGRNAAIVNISQQVDASILDVQQGVDQVLQDLSHTLPSGLTLSKVYDLADFVATAIANVRDAILIGGILAVIVLLVFLRDWRVTVVSAITLPLTVVSTFLFMRLFGESINLMSMGGLAVAIGLVIDDAVVVVENIFRRMEGGAPPEAVWEATAELVAPVVGSTLTTVVVLVPLGLLSGVVGQFFRALSLTLSVAVLISLFLALWLIPLLARFAYRHRGQRGEEHAEPKRPRGERLEAVYARALGGVMRRPLVAAVGALGLAVLGVLLYLPMPSGFLPEMDEGGFVIDYLTPPGTALEETDRLIRKAETLVAATPEVASFSRRTGSELGLFATQQNRGDILVRLKPRRQRKRTAEQVIEALRGKVHEALPNVDIEFVQILQDMIGDLEGAPTPIEVKIFGDDPDELARLGEQVEPVLAGVKGVVDVVGVQRGGPEVTWQIDPVAAGRAGLTVDQVSSQLAAAWLGESPTSVRQLDRQVPVRVRYPDAVRFDPARLGSTPVRGADGKLVPLSTLGRSVPAAGEIILARENLRQMALLTARLEGRDLGSAVQELRARLAKVRLPVGYSFEVGGQYESQRQAFRELLMVFGIAASLVFLIMVFEFRAFLPALLILGAAPLSLGGAFLLLWLTGTELNVSAAMGLILLVGLVVKNGIVMLDYAHHLHAADMPFAEAVAGAARVRLRPILMTTLCTLFGLLPLALGLGAGAELQKPLALAVIGGLGLSTLVTLFAVPTVYVALHGRFRSWRRRA